MALELTAVKPPFVTQIGKQRRISHSSAWPPRRRSKRNRGDACILRQHPPSCIAVVRDPSFLLPSRPTRPPSARCHRGMQAAKVPCVGHCTRPFAVANYTVIGHTLMHEIGNRRPPRSATTHREGALQEPCNCKRYHSLTQCEFPLFLFRLLLFLCSDSLSPLIAPPTSPPLLPTPRQHYRHANSEPLCRTPLYPTSLCVLQFLFNRWAFHMQNSWIGSGVLHHPEIPTTVPWGTVPRHLAEGKIRGTTMKGPPNETHARHHHHRPPPPAQSRFPAPECTQRAPPAARRAHEFSGASRIYKTLPPPVLQQGHVHQKAQLLGV